MMGLSARAIQLAVLALCGVLLSGLVFACAPSPADIPAIRAYADQETEITLQGLSQNDYTGYSRYFNQKMKDAVTAEVFTRTATLINGAIGGYVSKDFESVQQQGGMTVVVYRAQYSSEPEGVTVKVIFDQDHLITGLWFDSPRLRQAT